MSAKFSHIDNDGNAIMVDIHNKPVTTRIASAHCIIYLNKQTIKLIQGNKIAKGNVLAVARTSGIMSAKKTAWLIPMCHQLNLSQVTIDFEIMSDCIKIIATVKVDAKTGAEMEALLASNITALTIYDMCKAVDKNIRITDLNLIHKSGGKHNFTNKENNVS